MNFALIASVSTVSLFVAMLGFVEAGRRIGRARLARDAGGLAKGSGAAEGAIFGLLGLLVAFTFSGAASRFEDRRHLVSEEANAIGTAYLRLDLLPGEAQPEIRTLFRRYVDLRAVTYRDTADLPGTRARLAEGTALQEAIWAKAWAACQRPEAPTQATMLLLPALNQMIDITGTRQMATINHPPVAVFLLLGAVSFIGALLVGYSTSTNMKRSWFHTLVFASMLSLTVYVIVDLEFPRFGIIRVDAADQALINLRESMH